MRSLSLATTNALTLPIPGADPWHADPNDPALTVMTDFRERASITVSEILTIDAALDHMKHTGVRCAFAIDDENRVVVGLITAYDIMSEKPMRQMRSVHTPRHEILVRDIMQRIADWRVADIRELAKRVLAAQYPVLRGWAWLSVATRAASTLTVVAIFLLGASMNGRGEVTVGNIVTFAGFAMLLIGRLEQFAGFISGMFIQIPALQEFFKILDMPLGLEDAPGALQLPKVRGEVVFENVSFAYADPRHPALRSLSFRAPAGATIALVGPTGAGKTTTLYATVNALNASDRNIMTIEVISRSYSRIRDCCTVRSPTTSVSAIRPRRRSRSK